MDRSAGTKKVTAFLTIISVVFIAIGVIIGALGGIMYFADKQESDRCTETVTALVTDMRQSSSSHAQAPVFSFTADGKVYTVKMNTYSSPPKYSVGDTAELRYDPTDPNSVYDDSDNFLRYMAIGFGGGGVLEIAVGIITMFAKKRYKKNHESIMYQ